MDVEGKTTRCFNGTDDVAVAAASRIYDICISLKASTSTVLDTSPHGVFVQRRLECTPEKQKYTALYVCFVSYDSLRSREFPKYAIHASILEDGNALLGWLHGTPYTSTLFNLAFVVTAVARYLSEIGCISLYIHADPPREGDTELSSAYIFWPMAPDERVPRIEGITADKLCKKYKSYIQNVTRVVGKIKTWAEVAESPLFAEDDAWANRNCVGDFQQPSSRILVPEILRRLKKASLPPQNGVDYILLARFAPASNPKPPLPLHSCIPERSWDNCPLPVTHRLFTIRPCLAIGTDEFFLYVQTLKAHAVNLAYAGDRRLN
eukprot:GILK01007677.1.p1 GENE.GILK01007677.1~~GILK01007677.1.p1  ORF type:complete len:334 (-),score=15.52 GILK01007677.1:81-1043(-)